MKTKLSTSREAGKIVSAQMSSQPLSISARAMKGKKKPTTVSTKETEIRPAVISPEKSAMSWSADLVRRPATTPFPYRRLFE